MRWLPPVLVIAALLLLLGCERDSGEERFVTVDHAGWARTTSERLDFQVPGHGAGARRIYINPVGETVEPPASADEAWDYPQGTIIVKEVYASANPPEDAPPERLAIMVKNPDHPMSRGGWIWIGKSPGSDEERVFTEQFCVTCHANANEQHPYSDRNREGQFRDYTFYPYWGRTTID